jgi:hypothetical protein
VLSALLVHGQTAYTVPKMVGTLGSAFIGLLPWIVVVASVALLLGHLVLKADRPLRLHSRRQPATQGHSAPGSAKRIAS